jgi:hypothetical protein
VIQEYQNEISDFDIFVKTIIDNCQNLEKINIFGVELCPPIAQYISENYEEHCVVNCYAAASEIVPTKASIYCDLSSLTQGLYPSKIEYLGIGLVDLNFPFEEPWRNYKSILAVCVNLKGIQIHMYKGEQWFNLQNALGNMSEENQDIWEKRILYLKSIGVELMSREEYILKMTELCKESKWGFYFLS